MTGFFKTKDQLSSTRLVLILGMITVVAAIVIQAWKGYIIDWTGASTFIGVILGGKVVQSFGENKNQNQDGN